MTWIPRGRTYFLVDTLEYLQKGGRIGGAKALLGELLQVKPILAWAMDRFNHLSSKGQRNAPVNRLIEVVDPGMSKGRRLPYLFAYRLMQEQKRDELADRFSKHRLDVADIPIYEMPPAIVVHGGPGILGVAFFAAESPMV